MHKPLLGNSRPAVGQPALRRVLPLTALLGPLLLAACAGAPTYHAPSAQPALEAGFLADGVQANGKHPSPTELARFWRGFKDGPLDALIEQTLAANADLKVAEARLQEARANLGFAEADRLPSLGANADGGRTVTPSYALPGASRSQRTYSFVDASFVASWELDLFGRASSARDAASALLAASAASLDAVHLSVVAEVARNYLQLRGNQERMQVTQEALKNQRDTLGIVRARYDAGRATELDLRRAEALVQSTEAQIPALQTAIDLGLYHLATLCGQTPRAVSEALRAPAPLPGLPLTDLAALPLGTPSTWLARRPDLIAAERQLYAANANIGVSRAELYPHISLTGLLGLSSSRLSELGKSESLRYGPEATLSWNVLDFGRIRARIDASEARAQTALATWQQTLRSALEETEGAFSTFNQGQQRTRALEQAAGSSEAAAKLARMRYEAGVTDFLAVLDAERDALSTRDQWVQARSDTASALVAVYRTLGGGWEAPGESAQP